MVEKSLLDNNTHPNSRNRQLPSKASEQPCLRCGSCCRKYQPCLNAEELAKLAAHLGLNSEQFIGRYTDRRWPGTESFLLLQKRGACVFLTESADQAFCVVHAIKPGCCREWEPDLLKPECQAGLKKRFELAVDAEGHIRGCEKNLAAYENHLKGTK